MAFVRATKKDEVPVGSIKEIELGDKTFAVANVEGKFFALDNICLHLGGPIGQGDCSGGVVACPWHGWEYDIATGKLLTDPEQGLQTYPVEVRGDEVFVDVG